MATANALQTMEVGTLTQSRVLDSVDSINAFLSTFQIGVESNGVELDCTQFSLGSASFSYEDTSDTTRTVTLDLDDIDFQCQIDFGLTASVSADEVSAQVKFAFHSPDWEALIPSEVTFDEDVECSEILQVSLAASSPVAQGAADALVSQFLPDLCEMVTPLLQEVATLLTLVQGGPLPAEIFGSRVQQPESIEGAVADIESTFLNGDDTRFNLFDSEVLSAGFDTLLENLLETPLVEKVLLGGVQVLSQFNNGQEAEAVTTLENLLELLLERDEVDLPDEDVIAILGSELFTELVAMIQSGDFDVIQLTALALDFFGIPIPSDQEVTDFLASLPQEITDFLDSEGLLDSILAFLEELRAASEVTTVERILQDTNGTLPDFSTFTIGDIAELIGVDNAVSIFLVDTFGEETLALEALNVTIDYVSDLIDTVLTFVDSLEDFDIDVTQPIPEELVAILEGLAMILPEEINPILEDIQNGFTLEDLAADLAIELFLDGFGLISLTFNRLTIGLDADLGEFATVGDSSVQIPEIALNDFTLGLFVQISIADVDGNELVSDLLGVSVNLAGTFEFALTGVFAFDFLSSFDFTDVETLVSFANKAADFGSCAVGSAGLGLIQKFESDFRIEVISASAFDGLIEDTLNILSDFYSPIVPTFLETAISSLAGIPVDGELMYVEGMDEACFRNGVSEPVVETLAPTGSGGTGSGAGNLPVEAIVGGAAGAIVLILVVSFLTLRGGARGVKEVEAEEVKANENAEDVEVKGPSV